MPAFRRSVPFVVLFVLGLAGSAWAAPDFDGDGFAGDDCAPLDPAVHPGASDSPDLAFEDSDCDGVDGRASAAFFVSRSAGSDAGTGSREIPFATIQFAIDRAAAASPKRDVYVIGGSYSEAITLRTGVSLYGGYTPSGARSSADATTLKASATSAQTVLGDGSTRVELQLLEIRGPDRSGAGESSYALRAVNGSTLALSGVAATGGSAAAGAHGLPGAPGSTGDDGGCGGWGVRRGPGGLPFPACFVTAQGGAPGADAVAGGAGGTAALNANGGNGAPGSGPAPGRAGGGGSQLATPRCALLGTDCHAGKDGGPGGAGAAGTAGAGASFTSAAAAATWIGGGAASAGAAGAAGSGGGGGGAGAGNVGSCEVSGGAGGGGGGAGGGGTPGGPGGNGGGSFGVYVFDSSVVVSGGWLAGGAAGAGGKGGRGGDGGTGGDGGSGAPSPGNSCGIVGGPGGSGGQGGTGGQGGGGGGGAGGPSVALFGARASSFAVHGSAQVVAGRGGAGGQTSNSSTVSGAPGVAAPTLAQPSANISQGDFDQDGAPDATDACPADPAPSGCPERAPRLPDADGDRIPDGADACATEAAGALDANADGCPDIVPAIDRDRDGFTASQDCDDTAANIHPRARELPGNRIDENCDGLAAPFPRITASVSTAGTSSSQRTLVTRLLITDIPPDGKVELRCTAPKKARHACPFRRRPLRVRDGKANALSLLPKRRRRRGLGFGVDATVEVRITAPEQIGKIVRYRITKRAFPRGNKLCLPPAARKPTKCAP